MVWNGNKLPTQKGNYWGQRKPSTGVRRTVPSIGVQRTKWFYTGSADNPRSKMSGKSKYHWINLQGRHHQQYAFLFFTISEFLLSICEILPMVHASLSEASMRCPVLCSQQTLGFTAEQSISCSRAAMNKGSKYT